MELNPKIAGMAALINADRAADKVKTDASMKAATDKVTETNKSNAALLGIPEPVFPVDKQVQYGPSEQPKVEASPELKKMLSDIKADQDAELLVKPLFPI